MRFSNLFSQVRRSVVGRSLPSDTEEGWNFFQERLSLFAKAMFLIAIVSFFTRNGFFFVVDSVNYWDEWAEPGQWTHLGSCVAMAGVWWACRRPQLPAALLTTLDAFLILGICTAISVAVWLSAGAGDLSPIMAERALLVASNLLIFRALILPSSTLWTFALSTACAIPVVVFTSLTFEIVAGADPVAAKGGDPVVTGSFLVTQWALVSVTISTIASYVLFNLRRSVHKAKQLGQYTLEEKLGQGGMGVVYRASHAMLRRPTAVKLLRPDTTSQENLARFEREVQLTSRLTHPNTIAIYDYGRTPDRVFYYAMEYLVGIDLQNLVKATGALPQARVVYILEQLVSSLAEAHDLGLIHRDVKPANVFACRRGGLFDFVKVLDFGLVKDTQTSDQVTLSAENTITGTPYYLAPETIRTPTDIDGRADLYAVGAVAYFLVTGKPVFESKSFIEVCSHHLNTPPVTPSKRTDQPIAADFESVVLRCLAKDPAHRFADARALLEALDGSDVGPRWTQNDARQWWDANAHLLEPGGAVEANETEDSKPEEESADLRAPTMFIELDSRLGD